jgi:hypothetical protein
MTSVADPNYTQVIISRYALRLRQAIISPLKDEVIAFDIGCNFNNLWLGYTR